MGSTWAKSFYQICVSDPNNEKDYHTRTLLGTTHLQTPILVRCWFPCWLFFVKLLSQQLCFQRNLKKNSSISPATAAAHQPLVLVVTHSSKNMVRYCFLLKHPFPSCGDKDNYAPNVRVRYFKCSISKVRVSSRGGQGFFLP